MENINLQSNKIFLHGTDEDGCTVEHFCNTLFKYIERYKYNLINRLIVFFLVFLFFFKGIFNVSELLENVFFVCKFHH